ncbi:MAG TPA: type II toxin-antitoxin system VapC family toxin [Candidatus Acidoferrales bacterium]|nr:type II toxin-antitoxin system VapC family toxin [Candidatus Acidoferrales bacterium]
MSNFVLDASVGLAWAVDDPEPDSARAIRESFLTGRIAIVPSLWVLEIANGLVMAERRGKLDLAEVERARDLYESMMANYIEVQTDSPQAGFREIQEIARKHQVTAYDAAYLFLALQHRLPLATLDGSLTVAAQKSGVSVLP